MLILSMIQPTFDCIYLPRQCESQLTTPDDFGNEGTTAGSVMCAYEQVYQVQSLPMQYFFILHIQLLTNKEDIDNHS